VQEDFLFNSNALDRAHMEIQPGRQLSLEIPLGNQSWSSPETPKSPRIGGKAREVKCLASSLARRVFGEAKRRRKAGDE
jgi:hypothetical protein